MIGNQTRLRGINKESEFEAIILVLRRVRALGIKNLIIKCDSQFVANILTGEYCAWNHRIEAYMKLAQQLLKSFTSARIERFPRLATAT